VAQDHSSVTQDRPAVTQGHTDVIPDQYGGAESVVDQIVRFVRLMKRTGARFASQQRDGVELAAYHLLAVLATEGPQRTTALAEAVHSDTSTVSRQVGALVRHGLVERQADPADGRACLLAATTAGLTCFDHQRRARTEQIADVLCHWSSEDLRTVASLLERLNTDFEHYEQQMNTGATGAGTTKGGTR
jgi:DNA-binding MarR family transcriptional regulator